MLLFIIIKGQGWRKPITGFNTSHVTLYQGKHQGRHCVRQFQYITCYSLSQYPYRYKETQNSFQYITCYSLSGTSRFYALITVCFNTSHVTLYPPSILITVIFLIRFNTSHVTLYPGTTQTKSLTKWVSIHHMLLFININNNCAISCKSFNTSHVTLYRLGISDECPAKEFQYITCYSLSVHGLALCCIVGLFQYITCYSLSVNLSNQQSVYSCFNTSHVTLYRPGSGKSLHCAKSFNTSHVTLYLNPFLLIMSLKCVSIHHMLLFILQRWLLISQANIVSIHHMLLFIGEKRT